MYFVLPNLSMGSDRRGFDTLSVSFKCADSKPAFVDAAAQSGFDFTSKFFAAWDMAEACPAMTGGKLFLDPLFMHLSLLGGPRTRRWHLKAAFISISIDNASPEPGRPLYLPQISVMPGKEPIPLLDSQAIRLGGQGVLLWHPDATIDTPLQGSEHLLLRHKWKVMLRIRLISLDLDCWRDILLSFRFASGVCRLQPAVSPLGGSETSVSEQSLGDERLTLADVSRQDSHSSLATTSSL